MSKARTLPLAQLYEQDETAWLEVMADLVAQRRFAELDTENLTEYLTSMAKRDRREVKSRLIVLLAHLLKWQHQSGNRTGSWWATILEQRGELNDLLESGTLRNHAQSVFTDAYEAARARAAAETELPVTTFPVVPAFDLDAALDPDALI